MTRLEVAKLARWQMVAAAHRRAVVWTVNEVPGYLMCWDAGTSRGRARVQFRPGSGRTFRLHEIAWVEVGPEHSENLPGNS